MTVVAIVMLHAVAWGETYYLRADGTANDKAFAVGCSSPTTAMNLATHGSERFDPGDRVVLCDEGGLYRGELAIISAGTAVAPIVYDGQGSAVISGSDLVAGWTAVGGNVYTATVTVQPNQVFLNGSYGDRKTGTGGLVDELDWYWSSNTLYLYSPSNPATRYVSPGVEASARTRCVRLSRSHVTVTSLTAKQSNEHNVMAYNSSGVLFDRLTSEWAWGLGITIGGNTLQSDNTIQDSVARYNGTGGISSAYSGSGQMTDHTYQRNTVHENGRYQHAEPLWWANHQFTFGIKLWGNHLSSSGVVIAENRAYDNGPVVAIVNSQKGNGIWIDEVDGSVGSPITIKRNFCHDNTGSGVFIENASRVDVVNNLLYSNANSVSLTDFAAGGVKILARVNYDSKNNTVFNNTIVDGIIGLQVTSYQQQSGLEVSNNQFKNNIVIGATRILRADDGGDNDGVWGTGNVYDNNSFGVEANDFISWSGADHDSYASWETAYGLPSNSVTGDPRLAGSTRDALYLTETSPCRDAGANLGSAYDDALLETSSWTDSVETADQDAHGNGWEVGAYVFSGLTVSIFAGGFETGNTNRWWFVVP